MHAPPACTSVHAPPTCTSVHAPPTCTSVHVALLAESGLISTLQSPDPPKQIATGPRTGPGAFSLSAARLQGCVAWQREREMRASQETNQETTSQTSSHPHHAPALTTSHHRAPVPWPSPPPMIAGPPSPNASVSARGPSSASSTDPAPRNDLVGTPPREMQSPPSELASPEMALLGLASLAKDSPKPHQYLHQHPPALSRGYLLATFSTAAAEQLAATERRGVRAAAEHSPPRATGAPDGAHDGVGRGEGPDADDASGAAAWASPPLAAAEATLEAHAADPSHDPFEAARCNPARDAVCRDDAADPFEGARPSSLASSTPKSLTKCMGVALGRSASSDSRSSDGYLDALYAERENFEPKSPKRPVLLTEDDYHGMYSGLLRRPTREMSDLGLEDGRRASVDEGHAEDDGARGPAMSPAQGLLLLGRGEERDSSVASYRSSGSLDGSRNGSLLSGGGESIEPPSTLSRHSSHGSSLGRSSSVGSGLNEFGERQQLTRVRKLSLPPPPPSPWPSPHRGLDPDFAKRLAADRRVARPRGFSLDIEAASRQAMSKDPWSPTRHRRAWESPRPSLLPVKSPSKSQSSPRRPRSSSRANKDKGWRKLEPGVVMTPTCVASAHSEDSRGPNTC